MQQYLCVLNIKPWGKQNSHIVLEQALFGYKYLGGVTKRYLRTV